MTWSPEDLPPVSQRISGGDSAGRLGTLSASAALSADAIGAIFGVGTSPQVASAPDMVIPGPVGAMFLDATEAGAAASTAAAGAVETTAAAAAGGLDVFMSAVDAAQAIVMAASAGMLGA